MFECAMTTLFLLPPRLNSTRVRLSLESLIFYAYLFFPCKFWQLSGVNCQIYTGKKEISKTVRFYTDKRTLEQQQQWYKVQLFLKGAIVLKVFTLRLRYNQGRLQQIFVVFSETLNFNNAKTVAPEKQFEKKVYATFQILLIT